MVLERDKEPDFFSSMAEMLLIYFSLTTKITIVNENKKKRRKLDLEKSFVN